MCRILIQYRYSDSYCQIYVKLFLYRPLVPQQLEVPKISKQSAYKGGKVSSPKHRPSLPPREDPWYSFLLEVKSTPGPQCDRKD